MGNTPAQQLVVDMLTIRTEQTFAAQEPPDDRNGDVQDQLLSQTMGIATAIMVGDLCDPAMAIALMRNPMSRLPQSPRKMEAGLKLNRRNPVIAPGRASVRTKDLIVVQYRYDTGHQ